MKCVSPVCLAVSVILLGVFFNIFGEPIWSVFVPLQYWYKWLPSEPYTCPLLDVDTLMDKMIPVPTIKVSDPFECEKVGRQMDTALLCEGPEPEAEKAVDAILSESTSYVYHCYDMKEAMSSSIIISEGYKHPNLTLDKIHDNKDCYVGFIHSTEHQRALATVMPFIDVDDDHGRRQKIVGGGGQLRLGNTFVSNFGKAQISAPQHAALPESLVYQWVGEKIFVVSRKSAVKEVYAILPVIHPFPGCVAPWAETDEKMYVARTKPGTYFYFPPMWRHTVYTSPGLNVMTNLRTTQKDVILKSLWYRDVFGLALRYVFGSQEKTGMKTVRSQNTKLYDFFFHADRMFDDVASSNLLKGALDKMWDYSYQ